MKIVPTLLTADKKLSMLDRFYKYDLEVKSIERKLNVKMCRRDPFLRTFRYVLNNCNRMRQSYC